MGHVTSIMCVGEERRPENLPNVTGLPSSRPPCCELTCWLVTVVSVPFPSPLPLPCLLRKKCVSWLEPRAASVAHLQFGWTLWATKCALWGGGATSWRRWRACSLLPVRSVRTSSCCAALRSACAPLELHWLSLRASRPFFNPCLLNLVLVSL